MKINEETTVSEEQVLFNKLRYEDQELIIKIMKSLQPCELSCEVEEEKKIPEKLNISNFPRHNNSLKKTAIKVNEIIDCLDYLNSKGE